MSRIPCRSLSIFINNHSSNFFLLRHVFLGVKMKIEIDVDEEETFENSTQRNWREKVITFVADNRKIHIIRTEIRVFISRGVQSRWIFWHRRLISSRWSRNQYEFFDRISARQRRNKKKVVENRIKINKNGKKIIQGSLELSGFFCEWLANERLCAADDVSRFETYRRSSDIFACLPSNTWDFHPLRTCRLAPSLSGYSCCRMPYPYISFLRCFFIGFLLLAGKSKFKSGAKFA